MIGRVLTTVFIGFLFSGCATTPVPEPSSDDPNGSNAQAAEAAASNPDPIQVALGNDVDWYYQSAAMVWDDGASLTDYEWRMMVVTGEELFQLHRDNKEAPYDIVHRTPLDQVTEISDPRANGGDGLSQPSYTMDMKTAAGADFQIQMSSRPNAQSFVGWMRQDESQQVVRESSDAYKTNRRTQAKRSPVL